MKGFWRSERFDNWLNDMYLENCKERGNLGEPLYQDVDAYFNKHPKWLREQYKKFKGEK